MVITTCSRGILLFVLAEYPLRKKSVNPLQVIYPGKAPSAFLDHVDVSEVKPQGTCTTTLNRANLFRLFT